MSSEGKKLELLTPFEVGGQTLKNRVVLAPLTRGRSDATRLPNDLMGLYYEQRATAGLVISEATAISDQGFGWRNAPGIYTSEMARLWKPIVDRVHAKGAIFYLQLWHMGRQSHTSYHENGEIVSASAIAIEKGETTTQEGKKAPYEVPRALRTDEISGVVEQYRSAAAFAKEAGFDGVEIHSANGYLIDQFLQSVSNKRTDQYGGSVENRARLLLEVIESIKTVYPANRIGFRISPNGAFGGVGSADNIETFTHVVQETGKLGLAYLHLMDGLGFGFHNKCRKFTAAEARRYFSGPIIVNIGLTKELAEGLIRSGAADLAAFGRLYISNPDLPERFANDWPVEPEAEHSTWWAHNTAAGYTDWPTYPESKQKTSKQGNNTAQTQSSTYCENAHCAEKANQGDKFCERHKSRTIAAGDKLPAVVLQEYSETEKDGCSRGPNKFDIAKQSAGKTIVIFGLPGAFTPTCSAKHVPGYLEKYDELKQHGVDEIWCVSVNDAFVMGAWARDLQTVGKIRLLGDGSGEFARTTGLILDLTQHGMGIRSSRYSLLVRDGKVDAVNIEAPGKFEVSDASTILKKLTA